MDWLWNLIDGYFSERCSARIDSYGNFFSHMRFMMCNAEEREWHIYISFIHLVHYWKCMNTDKKREKVIFNTDNGRGHLRKNMREKEIFLTGISINGLSFLFSSFPIMWLIIFCMSIHWTWFKPELLHLLTSVIILWFTYHRRLLHQ